MFALILLDYDLRCSIKIEEKIIKWSGYVHRTARMKVFLFQVDQSGKNNRGNQIKLP